MKKINKNLLLYVIIVFIKQLSIIYFPNKVFGYLLVVSLLILFCFEKKENYLPTILFFHPCSALFDDISFPYIFNLVIVIFTIKYLFFSNRLNKSIRLNKKMSIMTILLLLYEIFLILLNGYLGSEMISLVSWIFSYFFVLQFIKLEEHPDLKKCLNYFFLGYLCGAISGLVVPFLKYGFNFPTNFRYMGLFRDPNVYSLDALLIIFSSFVINKKISLTTFIVMILGCLSVSKMFILLLIVGLLFWIILQVKTINIKKIIRALAIICFIFFIGIKTPLFDTIYTKYSNRISGGSLTTGRTEIIEYYVGRLYDKPLNLVFGSSNAKYRFVLVDYNHNRALYEAHNTYLELILAWGILGSIYYLIYICNLVSYVKKKYNYYKFNLYALPLIISFLLSIFSLAYLSADIFIIMVLYISLFTYLSSEEMVL